MYNEEYMRDHPSKLASRNANKAVMMPDRTWNRDKNGNVIWHTDQSKIVNNKLIGITIWNDEEGNTYFGQFSRQIQRMRTKYYLKIREWYDDLNQKTNDHTVSYFEPVSYKQAFESVMTMTWTRKPTHINLDFDPKAIKKYQKLISPYTIKRLGSDSYHIISDSRESRL